MRRKAFTLVELIVATGIFSMLLASFLYVFGAEIAAWHTLARRCKKQQIINLVLARLTVDLRSASAVLPGSSQNLLIMKTGPDTIEFSLADHKVKRRKNIYASYLTAEDEIRQLTFAYPQPKLVILNLDNVTTEIALRN